MAEDVSAAPTRSAFQRKSRRVVIPKPPSAIEEAFALHLRTAKLPEPEREFAFHPTRKWRFDFAWPTLMVAVECEGGIWIGGRHSQPSGFLKDCEKYNSAAMLGWRVLRFPAASVKSGEALEMTKAALA